MGVCLSEMRSRERGTGTESGTKNLRNNYDIMVFIIYLYLLYQYLNI